MVKHILLLYIARTSSSYIWQLFKGFKNVHVYGEVLNASEKYLKPLNAPEKLGIPDETEEYRKFARKNLRKYLEFLGRESPEEYYFTKISLVHVFSLLKNKSHVLSKILHDPDTKIIVLQRNLIDTYTSLKKVGITNAWREKDTTDLRIEIDHDDFLHYYNRMTMLYKNLYEMLEGKDYLILNYNDLHPPVTSSDLNDLDKAKYLQKRIGEIGLGSLEIDLEKFQTLKFMFQQDKNTRHQDKIRHFKAFRKFLSENEII